MNECNLTNMTFSSKIHSFFSHRVSYVRLAIYFTRFIVQRKKINKYEVQMNLLFIQTLEFMDLH